MTDLDFDDVVDYEEVSIDELDSALIAVRKQEDDYKAKKKVSDEAKKDLDKAKTEFMTLLKRSGKTRWDVTGYKGFSMYDDLSFKVPDGMMNKDLFFQFLQSEKVSELLGADPKDLFLTYATINSRSFNTLCKQLKELAAKDGEDLDIPGTVAPKAQSKLRSI